MVKKYDAHVRIYIFRGKFNNFVINLWFKAFVSPYSEITIILASWKQFEARVLVHILIINSPDSFQSLTAECEFQPSQ